MRAAELDVTTFQALVSEGVPLADHLGCRVERFAQGDVLVRLPWAGHLLRPGGTISGPAMMTLADIVLWGAVLSHIGKVELAVTTDLTFHFLSKPPRGADLLATARVLRLGRTLAVAEATILGGEAVVAHAVGTYAIPPERA